MNNIRFKKAVLLILDGLGDLPVPALKGATPLEAARTPVLDRLASAGQFGLVDPIGEGIKPNTHTGCGALFGVPPNELRLLKRGPVEAAGAGYALRPGDIAMRANFATLELLDGAFNILDRRAGRIVEGTQELAAVLQGVDLGDGITADLQPTDQHRAVLVLYGPGLDPDVRDTDPGDRKMPARVLPCIPRSPGASLTAEKIDRFLEIAHQRLEEHPLNLERVSKGLLPANGVLTRGAGEGFTLENVVMARGVNAAVVAACNTVIGLARTIGFEALRDPRFTADASTDIPAKIETAVAALQDHDLVYVHIKAPDLFAHDHQPEGKKKFLQRVDQAIGILEQAGVVIALAADHSTDSNSGSHTADPVPALIYDPSASRTNTREQVQFGERACAQGNMPRQTSHALLQRLLDLMDNS